MSPTRYQSRPWGYEFCALTSRVGSLYPLHAMQVFRSYGSRSGRSETCFQRTQSATILGATVRRSWTAKTPLVAEWIDRCLSGGRSGQHNSNSLPCFSHHGFVWLSALETRHQAPRLQLGKSHRNGCHFNHSINGFICFKLQAPIQMESLHLASGIGKGDKAPFLSNLIKYQKVNVSPSSILSIVIRLSPLAT